MECCIELNILNNFLSVSCLLQLELKADDHNYSTWLLYLYLWRKSATVKAELEILNGLSGVRFPLQLELKTDDYRYSTWLFISSYGGKQRRAELVGKYVYVLFYHTKVNGWRETPKTRTLKRIFKWLLRVKLALILIGCLQRFLISEFLAMN